MEMSENLKKKSNKLESGRRRFIGIAISEELSEWLYINELSPSSIFKTACEELGFKPTTKSKSAQPEQQATKTEE